MRKLLYSPEAVDDLARLREFIALKNPSAARRVASELLAGIGKLTEFPRMGLKVAQAPDPDLIRDLFIQQYTIRYLLAEPQILVLRVWHDKENEKSKEQLL